jgi:nitric oxide reductase NorE protein
MTTLADREVGSLPVVSGKRIPGEAGVWIFILGDMAIFAVLFVTFLHGRAADTELFAVSQRELNQNYGVANTLLLLLSSLFVVMAVRAVREGRGSADKLVVGAMFCGLAFSGLKILEYVGKIDHGITPASNNFFMYYFILTGLHWFHLVLGLAVLTLLVRLSRKEQLTESQLSFVEGGACFWHMVDLLWIVLFPLLYLVH